MEMLTNKEVKPLTIKLTNGKGEYDEQLTYKIKTAILDVVNEHIGISAQEVLKLLLNGLKMPKNDNINLYNYVRNATIWVIKNKRKEVSKPIGVKINVLSLFNDLRDNGYEIDNGVKEKYYEYLCYHVMYENPFLTTRQFGSIHNACLLEAKTFDEYLCMLEDKLTKINIPIPKEHIMEKAERKYKEWEEILKELDE